MKPIRVFGIAVLALFLGTAVSPVYAQDEKPQQQPAKPDDHPAKPDEHPAKPDEHLARPDEHPARPNEHPNMPEHPQEARPEEHSREATPATQQEGRERESEHVTVNKNVTVVNGQRRIPEATFRESFGREHVFTVNHITVVSGQPRFQYGGFWFGLGVPWPVGWAYADPVYIEFVDGEYFLFNVRHPGVRIGVVIL